MRKAILQRSFYIRPFLSVVRVHSLIFSEKRVSQWLKKMNWENLDWFKRSEDWGLRSQQALQIKTEIEILKKVLRLYLLWLWKAMTLEVRVWPPWGCWPRWEPEGREPRHLGKGWVLGFPRAQDVKGNGLEVRSTGFQRLSAFTGNALQESTPASCSYYFKKTVCGTISIYSKLDASC